MSETSNTNTIDLSIRLREYINARNELSAQVIALDAKIGLIRELLIEANKLQFEKENVNNIIT